MYTSIQITRKNSPEHTASVYELLQTTAQTLIKTLGGVFFAFIFATVFWPEQIAVNTWITVPISMILLVMAYWLLPRHYLAAITMLHISLISSITLAAYLFQQPEILFLYAMLPLMAVVALGWRAGVVIQESFWGCCIGPTTA
jgi:hypothetical protein